MSADPETFLNLIHIDDAASAVVAALDLGASHRVYLASDDQPLTRGEFYTQAAQLLGAPDPRFVSPEPGISAGGRSDANKRISNLRIKNELGLKLVYPDAKRGLEAAIREERVDRSGT
ncbi:MAG: hypothetical protein NVSMB9_04560 [Isosphaeraceae bacterium]